MLGLTGTKFGCGLALCGACTVHADGVAIRSCVMPISAVAGSAITTIEAVSGTPQGRALQQAWLDLDVVQCSYCQSGQIMSATALLAKTPRPTDSDIDAAMAGNVCRCGTYQRIRAGAAEGHLESRGRYLHLFANVRFCRLERNHSSHPGWVLSDGDTCDENSIHHICGLSRRGSRRFQGCACR